MAQADGIKGERVNLRLSAVAKRRIERAAALEGRPLSSFIVASVLEQAERTIAAHDAMELSRRDAERFLDAVLDPPRANRRLRAALDEHGQRVLSR
ncbi:type II toxin-antitoxin system TacA family antitoxin [Marinimicrococcus flavescens]|uniref:DUF1778 domain-containing protein n=1 Tax=Marinimicrococcus flavescens TaxID=3031815 RepID=A0AAP3UZB5_9PROT|nr:DUF1778 domain-containing protein [Marinimicrococcus flavescens]